jgi:AcrR family transcriptional regulator
LPRVALGVSVAAVARTAAKGPIIAGAARPARASRPPAAPPSLRDRKLRLVRARLAELALTPLLERGFDAVTIDDLAAAAGISRRTFFRYFATKEDVVISTFDEPGTVLLAELERRAEAEPPLEAMRSTLDAIIGAFARDRSRAQATLELIRRTPTLRGRFLVMQDDWIERVAAAIRPRAGSDVRAQLVARVAIAAVDTALAAWTERPAQDLRSVTAEAFDALGTVVDSTPRRRK